MTRSQRNDHPTPQALFDELNQEFGFDIDLCASKENAKCPRFLTEKDDFLRSWFNLPPLTAFMNAPYQKEEKACTKKCKKKGCEKRGFHLDKDQPGTGQFVQAAFGYSQHGATVVCLLPSRTGVEWFHDFAQPYGEIRFLKGRLTFEGCKDPAPFDSLIVIFRPPTP
jgi:site-specific DNA-methyltransferase (adenine-specific)